MAQQIAIAILVLALTMGALWIHLLGMLAIYNHVICYFFSRVSIRSCFPLRTAVACAVVGYVLYSAMVLAVWGLQYPGELFLIGPLIKFTLFIVPIVVFRSHTAPRQEQHSVS